MYQPSKFYDVPAGKIAAVVTHLEMKSRPQLAPVSCPVEGSLKVYKNPDPEWYLDLFRAIGEELLWFSRPILPRNTLLETLKDPLVEIRTLQVGGVDEGLLELDFRQKDQCELAYFGLTPGFIGKGIGRWMMNEAIDLAWSHPIKRFWVHTCTLDQPGIVAFYMRSGFSAYKRKIEIADDPRLTGALPRSVMPREPIIES
jgi:GNAT superfamily N-acetyltransferase